MLWCRIEVEKSAKGSHCIFCSQFLNEYNSKSNDRNWSQSLNSWDPFLIWAKIWVVLYHKERFDIENRLKKAQKHKKSHHPSAAPNFSMKTAPKQMINSDPIHSIVGLWLCNWPNIELHSTMKNSLTLKRGWSLPCCTVDFYLPGLLTLGELEKYKNDQLQSYSLDVHLQHPIWGGRLNTSSGPTGPSFVLLNALHWLVSVFVNRMFFRRCFVMAVWDLKYEQNDLKLVFLNLCACCWAYSHSLPGVFLSNPI